MFKDMPATYREAKKICSKTGGQLVEIETDEEYTRLEQARKIRRRENCFWP